MLNTMMLHRMHVQAVEACRAPSSHCVMVVSPDPRLGGFQKAYYGTVPTPCKSRPLRQAC